jgi:hypothetical protein
MGDSLVIDRLCGTLVVVVVCKPRRTDRMPQLSAVRRRRARRRARRRRMNLGSRRRGCCSRAPRCRCCPNR